MELKHLCVSPILTRPRPIRNPKRMGFGYLLPFEKKQLRSTFSVSAIPSISDSLNQQQLRMLQTTLTAPLNEILEAEGKARLAPAPYTFFMNQQIILIPTTTPPQEKAKKRKKSKKDKQREDTKTNHKPVEIDLEVTTKEIDAIISRIVGMEGLKLQLKKWIRGLVLHERRKALNLKVAERKPLHMAFLGNPGTGKTMVARLLGQILHKLGLIYEETVVEVQRTDLVGEYVGETGVKTREKIKEASGGILFVDEAYKLMPVGPNLDYGREALEEIMSVMNDGDIVVIFAGYTDQMQHIMLANPGFSRRVTKIFNFDDYSPSDIAVIMHSKMMNQMKDSFAYGFMLHPDCTVEVIAELISKYTTKEQLKKLNGGLVDPWLVNAIEIMELRLDVNCSDGELLQTIKMEDLEEGIKSLDCLRTGQKAFGFPGFGM